MAQHPSVDDGRRKIDVCHCCRSMNRGKKWVFEKVEFIVGGGRHSRRDTSSSTTEETEEQ